MLEEKFTFWCPLQKSEEILDPTTGEPIMRLGGIASTSDEDSDGEFLDPKGFDIKPLMKNGLVNWHHQAKGQPAAIIGEPTKAEIRPEGLYIETDLYPSSQIAHDVWNLANTLEKDSKTRRLGYSIEGKVLKRKSNDRNSPDYKHIVKAVITGVAITHMPKNPKTFANIIKGEIDDYEEEDPENQEKEVKKDLNTENGAPLKKESVDSDLKVTTFKKSQIIERILQDTSISIEKAEQVFELIKNIAKMSKKKTITDEDITKAYEALGIQKGDGCKACGGDERDLEKDKSEEEAEEEDMKVPEKKDTKEEESEEEREEDYDEEDQPEAKETNKAMTFDFDEIQKSMLRNNDINVKYMKALGVLVKAASDKLDAAAERENEMMEIIKSQEETISDLSDRIESFGSSVPGRKSIGNARAVERQFAKGSDSDFTKGQENELTGENVFSMSRNKSQVVELLDQASFAKGFDEELSKACVSFEATNTLPANIISRMKKEFNIEIVK
jgi:hypothetical protein